MVYLGPKTAVGDAIFVAILQACGIRVGGKEPYVLGRTERAEHIWRVVCCPISSDNQL